MADSGKDLNDYTVIELKSFLQILGAKTSGAKAELIQRLSSLNKEAGRNAWYIPERINQSTEEDNGIATGNDHSRKHAKRNRSIEKRTRFTRTRAKACPT